MCICGKRAEKTGGCIVSPRLYTLIPRQSILSRESLLAAAEESAFKAGPGPDLVRAAGLKSEQIRRSVNTGSPESLFIRDPGISNGDLQPVAAAGERFRNAVSGAEKHLEFDGAVDPDELITCGAALCFQIQGAFPRTVRFVVQLRCLIDEAANIGQIPNLEKLVATIRSEQISGENVYQLLLAFDELYGEMDESGKKELLRAIIERIDLFPEKREDGCWIRNIVFSFPVPIQGHEVKELPLEKSTLIETVCLLGKKDIIRE